MDKRQRIGAQRALAQEALGKLKAATELFGIEDGADASDPVEHEKFEAWHTKVRDLERWLWDESPIA